MIRVVLADDHEVVRMGLRVLIEREDDMTVVGEADNGAAALHAVRRERPDILLLDMRMPGVDGVETLRRMVADPELARTRVVVVTTFEIDEYVFAALQAGAGGFVLKDTAPQDLVRAIRVVAGGDALLSPSVTRRVISQFSRRLPPASHVPSVDELTVREREIVGWVGTGLSNQEIAAELFLSPATVKTHVSRAMIKLGARTRAQLVVIAVQAGLAVER